MLIADNANVIDVRRLIAGRYVAYAGQLASMTPQQFEDVVRTYGGHVTRNTPLGRGVALLVVGQRRLPLGHDGQLDNVLRAARDRGRRGELRTRILTEEQFLDGLGLEQQREQVSPLLSTATLCELLGVSRQRISAWVKAGLVQPVTVQRGVWHFSFREVSAAQTLSDLTRSGVRVRRIQASLRRLRRWLPEMDQPLQQLSVLENHRELVIRMEDGELATPDGQLFLGFDDRRDDAPQPLPMRIDGSPRTAGDWYEQGLEQEQGGYLDDAAESYRQALRLGGPEAQVCFDLAGVLHQLGHRQQAMERYHQVLELHPQHADAWNNLGIVLSELDRRDEAVAAFRRAVQGDPTNSRAIYNLADTLDELGRGPEAAKYWSAYLRNDAVSEWAQHARGRLARLA